MSKQMQFYDWVSNVKSSIKGWDRTSDYIIKFNKIKQVKAHRVYVGFESSGEFWYRYFVFILYIIQWIKSVLLYMYMQVHQKRMKEQPWT